MHYNKYNVIQHNLIPKPENGTCVVQKNRLTTKIQKFNVRGCLVFFLYGKLK